MERIICIVIGYLFGIIQTGYIYGRINGIDIRNEGSGNAGTTNVMRTLGKKAGVITYIGDTLKAILAGVVVRLIFGESCHDIITLLVLYAGLGTILGHNYPFYLKFKGGKGIATSSGVIISIGYFPLIATCCAVFFGTMFISKYVSLASLVLMTFFFASFTGLACFGIIPNLAAANLVEACVLVFVFAVLAFVRHRSNIVRLVNGNERKIGQKKKEN